MSQNSIWGAVQIPFIVRLNHSLLLPLLKSSVRDAKYSLPVMLAKHRDRLR